MGRGHLNGGGEASIRSTNDRAEGSSNGTGVSEILYGQGFKRTELSSGWVETIPGGEEHYDSVGDMVLLVIKDDSVCPKSKYAIEGASILNNGTYHIKNGALHREGGPAIIQDNGYQVWFRHGEIHRDGGEPALTTKDGYKAWFKDGVEHREDGPAIVMANGSEVWCLHGQHYDTELKWQKALDELAQ